MQARVLVCHANSVLHRTGLNLAAQTCKTHSRGSPQRVPTQGRRPRARRQRRRQCCSAGCPARWCAAWRRTPHRHHRLSCWPQSAAAGSLCCRRTGCTCCPASMSALPALAIQQRNLPQTRAPGSSRYSSTCACQYGGSALLLPLRVEFVKRRCSRLSILLTQYRDMSQCILSRVALVALVLA